MNQVIDRFEKFSKVKVLVIGDVMIDKYLSGEVNRISPEAPVPVVKLKNTSLIAGGAANVAANIAGLGAEAFLVGITGDDFEGKIFPEILAAANVSGKNLIKIENRQTTLKTRIIAHNQQIVRLDQETVSPLHNEEEILILQRAEKLLDQVDVVVFSDYNKGFLSESLLMRLITSCRSKGKIILVDPKGKDFSKYLHATIITPNRHEFVEVTKLEESDEDSFNISGKELIDKLNLKALLITRGEEGMTLIEAGKSPVHLNALARNVYDVTGAGDTVIATLAVAIGAGESFLSAANIANTAAGLVVRELGTTSIKLDKLKEQYSEV